MIHRKDEMKVDHKAIDCKEFFVQKRVQLWVFSRKNSLITTDCSSKNSNFIVLHLSIILLTGV